MSGSESKPVFGIEMRAIFLSCYMKPFLITGCQCLFITTRSITKVKVTSSLCLTKHYAIKTYGGSGCIDPRFLDLGTSWRWVVSFTPLPLYPRVKSPLYPLDRRLGEPQRLSGRYVEAKVLDSTGTRTPTPRPSSPQPVAIPTALPRFRLRHDRTWSSRKLEAS
jgi:hypothetical protein